MKNMAFNFLFQKFVKNSLLKSFFGLTLIFLSVLNIFATGGGIDPTFNAGVLSAFGSTSTINEMVVQPDGRIVIVGSFTVVGGVRRNRVARLNADGTLDTSFNTSIGADANVFAVALQDDKILIAGFFNTVNGVTRRALARLNADGSVDQTFLNVANTFETGINKIIVQPDKKIILAGVFNTTSYRRIARLNADGTPDSAFNSNLGTSADSHVTNAALQPNGKIVISGAFTTIDGVSAPKLARINADGTIDQNFSPNPNSSVDALAVQPDGKILVGGSFTNIAGVNANRLARLNDNGSLDSTFNIGTGSNSALRDIVIRADGGIIVSGFLTSYNSIARKKIAVINSNGSLDQTFNFTPDVVSTFDCIAVQLDGKILVGGAFSAVGTTQRTLLAQIEPNGNLDAEFAPPLGGVSEIASVALQSDGKILIGGGFNGANEELRNRIARLNGDGTLDNTFNPGDGADADVYTVVELPNQQILIGGVFTKFNNVARRAIARLNADGSLDTTFAPTIIGDVQSINIQTDGKILVGGNFTAVNSVARSRFARLNTDGTVDTTFVPPSFNAAVVSSAIQPSGKIVVVGTFSVVSGSNSSRIVRLNTDGSIDTTFNVNGVGIVNDSARTVKSLADGKLLIGGGFTKYNNVTANRLARLTADGELDATFNVNAGASSTVESIALQTDGKILLGGSFTQYNGVNRNRLTRINEDGSLDVSFNPGTGASAKIAVVVVQADNRILIGGDFDQYNGTSRLSIARLAAGSTNRWLGAANADFNNAANWSDGNVPTSSDNIVIENGAPVLSGNFSATNLQINSGASLTIAAGAILTLQGLSNDGTLDGAGTLELIGPSFVNNGTISTPTVNVSGNGAKSLSGNGSFTGNVFNVGSNVNLRLDSEHTFNRINIASTASFNIASRVVRLNGAGSALQNQGNFTNDFSTVVYQGNTAQTIGGSGIGFYNLTVNNQAGTSLNNQTTIRGNLNLQNGILRLNSNVLNLTATASATTANGYVIGKIQKVYAAGQSFVFPIGTDNGYSPVSITATSGTPTISIFATQTNHSTLSASNSLKRFWTIASNGELAADVQFSYLQTDVTGNEANYKITKINGASVQRFENNCPAICVNQETNTATISGVTSFSDWTLSEQIAPTAAPADVRGRVLDANAQPLANVRISALNSATGETFSATSDASGNYNLAQLETGAMYIVTPQIIGFRFNPQSCVLNHTEEVLDLDFTAERARRLSAVNDFDGDGKTDIAVFRPTNNFWYILRSSDNSLQSVNFGAATDTIATADYDGDGKTDVAVFREGVWFIKKSDSEQFRSENFGQAGDVPTVADYDGDGKADISVFRPSNGAWYRRNSSNNQLVAETFGQTGDVPVTGDFDGDGKFDIAVFRPAEGKWFWLNSGNGKFTARAFGFATDTPVAGDFDADGKSDIAVFRESNGVWYVQNSSSGSAANAFGQAGDIPAAGDFDGDGKTDLTVFRNGNWYFNLSAGNQFEAKQFGIASDKVIK